MENKRKKVHYAIFENMRKNIRYFNSEDYESNSDETDPSVISYLQNYYDNNLPVNVTAWARVNKPRETLIYKGALTEQVQFVRDILTDKLIFSDLTWYEHDEPMVISYHHSKSVKLPVFKIARVDYGIEFILRCNIYDWKISVKSKKPLDIDFMGLFNLKEEIYNINCEGFPKDKVYGCYEKNHSQFTIKLDSDYDVYLFFYLVKSYLGIKNNHIF